MSKIIGFYNSSYSEPRKGLKSLGGEPSSLLDFKGESGNIFNEVEEYESTTATDDYRIIYLGNLSKSIAIIESSLLKTEIDFDKHIDKSNKLYLSNVQLNIFVPSYADRSLVHPIIYANGVFRDGTASLASLIEQEANQSNYGRSVVINTRISPGEYFPIVLHRRVRSPVTYIKNFSFKLSANYAVGS